MRKPIRIAMLAGAAGVVVAAGGTTAALATHGSSQQPQATAFHSIPSTVPLAVPGKVSTEQARQIAQRLVPGGTVTETDLDHRHGRAVWEVDLHQQHRDWEVTIDAATGQVISVHHDAGMGEDD